MTGLTTVPPYRHPLPPPYSPSRPGPHAQARLRDADKRVEDAATAAAAELAVALGDTQARHETALRLQAAEHASSLERARDAAAAAAVERDRADSERARQASLERLEWMKERQRAEEGAWSRLWGRLHSLRFALVRLCCLRGPRARPHPPLGVGGGEWCRMTGCPAFSSLPRARARPSLCSLPHSCTRAGARACCSA